MNSHDIYNLQEAYMEVYADELDEEITPEKRRRYKAKLAVNQREQERYSPKYKPRKRATLPYAYDRSPRSGPITQADRDKLRDLAREENPDRPEGPGGLPRGKKLKRQKKTGFVANENYDLYDIILSHLIDEGYAETPEAAEVIMINMSEDWRVSIVEATAMAKRGYDEAPIRKKIAANTGGGESADRATNLERRPTYGNSNVKRQREKLARTQRGNFRDTTSSNPGLHGYAYKSDDSAVRAKQSARGAQRGVLTPNEKSALNR